MKHIIVAGAPRSGKTTLSRRLIYPGYVHYRLDSIIRAFFKNFPPDYKDWHKASKLTVQLIEQLVDDNEQESIRKEYFIFDSPHLYPNDVAHLDKTQYLMVF
jgi:dephospho-CoA kinase